MFITRLSRYQLISIGETNLWLRSRNTLEELDIVGIRNVYNCVEDELKR